MGYLHTCLTMYIICISTYIHTYINYIRVYVFMRYIHVGPNIPTANPEGYTWGLLLVINAIRNTVSISNHEDPPKGPQIQISTQAVAAEPDLQMPGSKYLSMENPKKPGCS